MAEVSCGGGGNGHGRWVNKMPSVLQEQDCQRYPVEDYLNTNEHRFAENFAIAKGDVRGFPNKQDQRGQPVGEEQHECIFALEQGVSCDETTSKVKMTLRDDIVK